MMQNKYGTLLREIINSIHQNYQANELAYIALTSKIENPLRDKIAFGLQKRLNQDKIVCREWKSEINSTKADIAIIDNKSNLECLIEFKAHSAIKRIGQWNKDLINDFNKCLTIDYKAESIFVLFANFIDILPENKTFERVIKYYSDISKSIDKKYTKDQVVTEWKNALDIMNIKCDLKQKLLMQGTLKKVKLKYRFSYMKT